MVGCNSQLATLTADGNGDTKEVEVKAGTVYIKELSAPKGYMLDSTVHALNVEVGKTATLTVADTPKVTETLIDLFKIDMETGKSTPQGTASLEGAEFTWSYYDGYYNADNLPAKATRTWTTKTVAEKDSDGTIHYVSRLADSYKVSGDSFYTQYINTDAFSARILVEKVKEKMYVVQNPPAMPLTQMEMDDVYSLPYMRDYHPVYKKMGGIPALSEIKFSLTSNRGCFGGCSFCALTFHQGRIIQTRSHENIIEEAELMTHDPDFKGYIHDVGGPTANFRRTACDKQLSKGACVNKQCLFPKPCKNLVVEHKDYISLLRKLRKIPSVKKVFIRSGIRFDYCMEDSDDTFLRELCENHISGQLRVAPEHISDKVLSRMGKPSRAVYDSFIKRYKRINDKTGKEQFVVPYLMSSHPGSTMKEAIELAEYVRDLGYMPEQVQDFYPTPSTLSTCMYYTGYDPRTMEKVYTPVSHHEKEMQRALIQYKKPENYDLVKEALLANNRNDLIGFGPKCLIPPRKIRSRSNEKSRKR